MKSIILLVCVTAIWAMTGNVPLSSAHDINIKGKEESKNYEKETFTGDWGTVRSKLRDQGILFELEYFGDVFSQVTGGPKRGTGYSGMIDMELYLDGGKLFGWQGSKFSVYAIVTGGDSLQNKVGSIHDVSSLEAPDGFSLFEMWYEQSLLEEKVFVLLGLYDVDREFDYRPTAQLFMSGAFGTGIDLSGSGRNGPSIFPVTSLGGRLKVQPKPDWYYQAAVVDGVPGDPANSNGTHINWDDDDGLLVIQEIGYETLETGRNIKKASVGGWFYTTELEDLVRVDAKGESIKHAGTYGIYFFVDGTLYPENTKPIDAFFRVGMADERVNQVNYYIDCGLVYKGLFDKRPNDLFGVGVSVAHLSAGFKQSQKQRQIIVENAETQLEVTYQFQMGHGVSWQTALQYLFNPALAKDAKDALSVGFRLAIEM